MASFHFELVSPDKLLFNGQAEDVLVPGTEGDFVVLRERPRFQALIQSFPPGLSESHP